MRVTPFAAADYIEAHAAIHTGDDFVDRAAVARYYAAHPGYTARLDGQLLACAGIIVHWPGLGTAWAVWTPLGQRYALRIHRAVLAEMAGIVETYGLRRVQADVMADNAAAVKWVQALGFEEESYMPAYGPSGEGAWRYRRLK